MLYVLTVEMHLIRTFLKLTVFFLVLTISDQLALLQVSRSTLLSGIVTSGVLSAINPVLALHMAASTRSSSSNLIRLVFNGGDNMLGRAVQLTFPTQAPGEEDISDSCPASHYLTMCLHPSGHPDGDPGLTEIRELNQKGNYLWKDYKQLKIDPPPDLRILNLESHLTRSIDNQDVPTWKGIRYHTHSYNVDAMIRPYAETTHGNTHASPVVLSLANNHVMDYGREALDFETLPTLQDLKSSLPSVHTVGCGRNWDEASMPAVVDCGEKGSVEVFAVSTGCSGTPSSWYATKERSGLVGLPKLTSKEEVAKAVEMTKEAFNMHTKTSEGEKRRLRILSIHMGPNWAMKGEDEQAIACRREFAHRMIDECGVDIIYGHSSHHVRGMEVHNGKLILYGTGDIINDYEGFENPGEERYNRLGGIYVADIDSVSGRFVQLHIVPMFMNRLRLQRYRESSSKIWKPNERRLVAAPEKGTSLANFINSLSKIDAGGDESSVLSVKYVNEEIADVPGGPVLVSERYASN